MAATLLPVVPLTRAAFAPFGDVIETQGSRHYPINDGHAERFHDLAHVDVAEAGGRPLINVFRARPWPAPIRIAMLERHPLSSQAFLPLGDARFLLVVAPPGAPPAVAAIRAFVSDGRQGVNYARGTWHHPLLALEQNAEFVVVDRGGPGENCDLFSLATAELRLDWPPADAA
jgi:ureidoglycolate lyase